MCLDCDSPYHRRCPAPVSVSPDLPPRFDSTRATALRRLRRDDAALRQDANRPSVLTLPRWERGAEHRRRVEQARRSRPDLVLAAYTVLVQTGDTTRAARVLRGQA